VDIAYQVIGDGPIDLLLGGFVIPIGCMDEEPSLANFQRHLASFGRLIRLDVRGFGLSERGSPSAPPTHEQWVQDGLAVLDAVGSERAAVIAPVSAAADGLMLAVTHPERVSHLVVVNGTARFVWAPDYPDGLPLKLVEPERLGVTADPNAVEQGVDLLSVLAPSVAHDHAFRAWWDRAGNLGASPAMAQAMMAVTFATDVRYLLSQISVPTLIIQRTENPLWGVGHGRYLAENISGAKLVELSGADLLYWVGDSGVMLDEIEEFITGVRGGSGVDRVLATVLFTDIVGSTQKAAAMGDSRWRNLLDRHDRAVRQQVARFRGMEVDTAGDGFFVRFDSPGRGIEGALAIREALGVLGIDVRAGLHTGEIELRDDDVAGMAVHIGARVSALAGPGEVLVSSTVKESVVGSSVDFVERGEHALKGVPGMWRLFSVRA